MIPHTNPFLQVCFGPNRTEPNLFDGPSLPKSTDPPKGAINCPPRPDSAAWTLADIHDRLQLAADMIRRAHRLCRPLAFPRRDEPGQGNIMPCAAFRAVLDQLAEADKVLAQYVKIPHDPALYALFPEPLSPAGSEPCQTVNRVPPLAHCLHQMD